MYFKHMVNKIKKVASNMILPGALLAQATVKVDEVALGFKIPTLSTLLTFAIRAFFVVAGLMALLYLLLGALSLVTSGGNKENVDKARDKITNAVIGVIMIVAVLAVVATLEQVVFKQAVCFGLTCEITIPDLLQKTR